MDFIAVEIKTEDDIKMEIDDSVQSEPMTEVLYNVKCVLDGGNYKCGQCEYKGKDKQTLQQNEQSVHEGVKFNCNLCEYTSWSFHLKEHEEKRDDLGYRCVTRVTVGDLAKQ
jgi:hypothetical protein